MPRITPRSAGTSPPIKAGSADCRFCSPRLFRSHHRHRDVFYRPSADGSKLRRPFLSDRYFFISVRLLKRREKPTEPEFALLARAFNRARALHPFYLTAWVFLPDPSADGHCFCAPMHPTTISLAMKSVKLSLMSAVNRLRGEEGELGHPGSSTAPCAAPRNITKRSNTFT